MNITIEIQDTYANRDHFARTEKVAVDVPAECADLAGWANDTLFTFTGQGGQYGAIESTHEVKVIQCVDRPELVGEIFVYG